ncbi:L-type lectin-domain containing receptor kinase S.5 [Pyrus ussuriensis x Pyrus communis]|uniref:L-type lectin-domain containing receptor kinase S.5 n=1 Tax=Pyrus ussuriensis x Pyrus communis TaxID=2448454 RepID=A0A5N5GJ33_9ROSA|nr:L-type lectin-domain containing receptor kinase S.5 [Pyrus ussuriensis x Pyrus communis]
MAWHGLRLGCLLEMRKLLELDFSAAIDGAVNDGTAKIRAAKDKVLDKRIVKCKKWLLPPDHFALYSIFKHWIL